MSMGGLQQDCKVTDISNLPIQPLASWKYWSNNF